MIITRLPLFPCVAHQCSIGAVVTGLPQLLPIRVQGASQSKLLHQLPLTLSTVWLRKRLSLLQESVVSIIDLAGFSNFSLS